jgi:RNA polymerase sigma-70 factor (ECF subfamily)
VCDPGLGDETEDVVQEVMTCLVRELPAFQRQRTGSFRRWLWEITVRRLKAFYRQRPAGGRGQGRPLEESPLFHLSDPSSQLSRQWEEEHNAYVLRRLLDLIKPQFEEKSCIAFQRLFFDEASPAQVAAELGLSVNVVLVAKCRILERLRQEAAAFLDRDPFF